MKMNVTYAAPGSPSGHSWGMTEDGNPVCAFVQGCVMVRVEMTPDEAKEWGAGAIYIGIDAMLRAQEAAPAPAAGGQQRASALVGLDGLPMVTR